MVGLSEKLMDILDLNKSTYSGEDVKHLVECILMNEATDIQVDVKEQAEKTEKLMKEWMVGGQ